MPESRPRKKKSPRPKPVQQAAGSGESDDLADLIETLNGMGTNRRRLDARRMKIAAGNAGGLLPELLALAAGSGAEKAENVEDALCERIGALMYELAEAEPAEDCVGPGQVLDAVLKASADRVRRALDSLDAEPDGWRPAWILLSTLSGVASDPYDDRARDLIATLRKERGAAVLPESEPAAAELAGPPLWTCDSYGSRFAVIAPFDTGTGVPAAERSRRWYLWDIDACGYGHFTVYSGYFADADDAFAAWRAGVGSAASAESILAPVNDAGLVVQLLPTDLGTLEPGGESARQFAEYHRCRRLADTLRDRLGSPDNAPEPPMPDPAEYARRFTEWRARRQGDAAASPSRQPSEPDDVVAELAHNWCDEEVREIRAGTCSPHRVAHFAEHIRGTYEPDFAGQLMVLLPDWVAWWTECLGLPDRLAARCRPYADGEPHPALDPHGPGLDLLARVEE